jgi:hypothetical protein
MWRSMMIILDPETLEVESFSTVTGDSTQWLAAPCTGEGCPTTTRQ